MTILSVLSVCFATDSWSTAFFVYDQEVCGLREDLLGGTWGWPSQARHKRPRSTPIATLVFSPVLLFFFNRQSRIVSHMFALRFSAVLPGLEPPMFYLRKKNTKFGAKSDDRCSVSIGKWQKEADLWAACTSRGGQCD